MRVAAAQIAPVWLNRQATLERIVETVDQAAVSGVELLAFGECLLPGYPFWVERTDGARFDSRLQADLFAHYVDQAVCIEEGHLAPVLEAARRNRMTLVLGILERPADRGESVYASAVVILADGRIGSVQRKLMPTYEERLVWAIGDGHGLRVHRLGDFTMGALNCWENWMPLARVALHAQGEDLHVAIWPGNERNTRDITRFMAIEGRSFVLSASGLMRPEDWSEDLPFASRLAEATRDLPWARGGSCLCGPDGRWVIEPMIDKAGVFHADIDPVDVRRARRHFDPSGHYSRPDVFQLEIDRSRQRIARLSDD
jgi:nitrilase